MRDVADRRSPGHCATPCGRGSVARRRRGEAPSRAGRTRRLRRPFRSARFVPAARLVTATALPIIAAMSIQTDEFAPASRPPRTRRRARQRRAGVAERRSDRARAAAQGAGRIRRPGEGARAARDLHRRGADARRGDGPRAAVRPARASARRRSSHIIANELGVNLRQTSGPVLEKPKDLAAILTNLEKNDVLFIDEIHRLSPVVEEILYPALEDYQIDIMIGEGPAARSIKLELQPFTLIGATTRAGMLTNPLRDRFGIVARLEFYTRRGAGAHRAPLGRPARRADRRRGRLRDRAPLARHAAHRQPAAAPRARLRRREGRRPITKPLADKALAMLDVDPHGLDVMDRKLLEAVDPPLRRRPGRPRQRRRGDRRGARHDRGRDRAVPDPAGLPAAHAARPGRDARGVPPPRRRAAEERRGGLFARRAAQIRSSCSRRP